MTRRSALAPLLLGAAFAHAACGSRPAASERSADSGDSAQSTDTRDAITGDAPRVTDVVGSDDAAGDDASSGSDSSVLDTAGDVAVDASTDSAPAAPREALPFWQRLGSDDPVPLRFFGKSIALDGEDLIVGATGSDDGVDGAGGRVTHFRFDGERWRSERVLTPLRGDTRPYFGRALALYDGVAWIGSHGEDGIGNGDDAGAVDGIPLADSSPIGTVFGDAGDHLGLAVAAGPVGVCVGAPRSGEREQGHGQLLTPTATTRWRDDAVEPGRWYGIAAAALPDGCVFGADGTTNELRQAGAVRVCRGAEGQCVDVMDPAPGEQRRFGAAVAADGRWLAVGAPGSSVVGGQVLLYDLSTLEHRQTLDAPLVGDDFGAAVSLDRDALVVGAPLGDAGDVGSRDGVAYVYEARNGRFERTQTLRSPTPEQGAEFGHRVAADGQWVAVTARFDNGDVDRAGAAYLFRWSSAE